MCPPSSMLSHPSSPCSPVRRLNVPRALAPSVLPMPAHLRAVQAALLPAPEEQTARIRGLRSPNQIARHTARWLRPLRRSEVDLALAVVIRIEATTRPALLVAPIRRAFENRG